MGLAERAAYSARLVVSLVLLSSWKAAQCSVKLIRSPRVELMNQLAEESAATRVEELVATQ